MVAEVYRSMGSINVTDTLIPKGFNRIAESEFRSCTAGVYFNDEREILLVKLNDKLLGPFPPAELEPLLHVLRDVHEMKGRFNAV